MDTRYLSRNMKLKVLTISENQKNVYHRIIKEVKKYQFQEIVELQGSRKMILGKRGLKEKGGWVTLFENQVDH